MNCVVFGEEILERMVRAVEKVKDRLRRAAQALEGAGIPYAVVGGNAVAAWVATVDEAAVRNTQDVDIVLRRGDLERAKMALGAAGFVHCQVAGTDRFLDGEEAKARDAVHVVFAGEKVRAEYVSAVPDVDESESSAGYRVLSLESLVRMKLTSYRDKDRTHLRDLIEVGPINETWPPRFPEELAQRRQRLIDTPEG